MTVLTEEQTKVIRACLKEHLRGMKVLFHEVEDKELLVDINKEVDNTLKALSYL